MPDEIKLTPDQRIHIVAESLKSTYEDVLDMIDANEVNHKLRELDDYRPTFVPMYSYNYEEEKKELKKMKKAIARVHDWYSLDKLTTKKEK